MDPDHTEKMLQTVVVAMAGSVVLLVLSRRLKVSAIVLLLAGGVLLGPTGANLVQPDSLGDALMVFVSLAVGLILFEGGMTLDVEGYRSASGVISRLLTVGVAITWLGTALAVWLIGGVDPPMALLAGSLVIVTGPTVIAPILKRVRLTRKLSHILHWEGVLIDPIGVFVAILCFEWLSGAAEGTALANFGLRVLWGLGLGTIGGFVIHQILRRKIVPDELLNVSVLASAILVFGTAEVIQAEAGLLAVTVAGFVLGVGGLIELKQIRRFKAELADLMIGMLFVLLAARLELSAFGEFGWRGVAMVAAVMFLVRPLNVFASTIGLDLNGRERLFLSWMAPRGIVAASMASLFALRLTHIEGIRDPRFVETFTYSVIVATVVIQGFSAGPVARLLKLKAPDPTGWLIVGAHRLARRVARFIIDAGDTQVLLVDSNPRMVKVARDDGLDAEIADARDTGLAESEEMDGVGHLLALTDNEHLNMLLCQRWGEVLGRAHVYRWSLEAHDEKQDRPGKAVWGVLPKPSLISAELIGGEASAMRLGSIRDDRLMGQPIVAVIKGKVVLDPPQGDESPDKEDVAHVLYIRREADYLSRSIRAELVVRVEAADREALLAQLVGHVVAHEPRLNRDEVLHDLAERERAWPTALGHGIAVPHAYSSAIEDRLCVIAQVPEGVEFSAPDGEPVKLVFLLLSPPGDPEGHLATLAEIARMAGDEHVRSELMAAQDAAVVLETIRRFVAA